MCYVFQSFGCNSQASWAEWIFIFTSQPARHLACKDHPKKLRKTHQNLSLHKNHHPGKRPKLSTFLSKASSQSLQANSFQLKMSFQNPNHFSSEWRLWPAPFSFSPLQSPDYITLYLANMSMWRFPPPLSYTFSRAVFKSASFLYVVHRAQVRDIRRGMTPPRRVYPSVHMIYRWIRLIM